MKRVLIVDDDPSVLRIIRRMVESFGYGTMGEVCAIDALELIASGDIPDLIIVDIHMPKMDGLTMARQVRANENTRHIPLVALSGQAVDEVQATIGTCDAYVQKPVKAEKLEDVLKELLGE